MATPSEGDVAGGTDGCSSLECSNQGRTTSGRWFLILLYPSSLCNAHISHFCSRYCTEYWLILYFIICDDTRTTLVTIPLEYCNAIIMDPFLGKVFNNETDAFQFYNMYALRKGFGIRIRKQVQNVAGDTTYIEFVCSCEVCTTYRLLLKLN